MRILYFYQEHLVWRDNGRVRYRFDKALHDSLAASLSSCLGHFKLADARTLVKSFWRRNPFLGQYVEFDPARWRIVRRYEAPLTFPTIRSQYNFFRRLFRDDVLFFQVGCFVELYREDDREVAELLGLAAIRENRRGVRWGFPLRHLESCRRRLAEAGRSVVFIAEGILRGNVKEWFPLWKGRMP